MKILWFTPAANTIWFHNNWLFWLQVYSGETELSDEKQEPRKERVNKVENESRADRSDRLFVNIYKDELELMANEQNDN